MKSTDIAMIILIAAISVGAAYGLVSALPFLKSSSESVQVKTIDEYSSTMSDPDPDVFNKDAINPTVDITIGDTQPTAGQ